MNFCYDKIKITDVVHGQIELDSYLKDIIAREEFQRMRNVKQLGSAFMVYQKRPTSRYEHSIGVSYLANKLVDILERNSKIKIPLFYRKCVSIAGLLHDLGHGPYSHMWEYFIGEYFDETYHHEDISCRMVDRIFHHAASVFENIDEHKRGVRLIKALIQGDLAELKLLLDSDMYVAEIISNKFSEIDVDRIDYILRDILYMNYSDGNLDPGFSKFLENAQIIEEPDGVKHINYSENDLERIYCLFKNRIELHKQVYQNSDVIGVQILLCDFFKAAADNNFKFKESICLNDVTKQADLTAFIAFDDTILEQILSKLTVTTDQYKSLKHFIVNKKRFRSLNQDEYNSLRELNGYNNENFRVYQRSIEDPFKKFKIFLDCNILYNCNNNRVVINVDDVKRKLNLDVERSLEQDTDNETFYYFVEN